MHKYPLTHNVHLFDYNHRSDLEEHLVEIGVDQDSLEQVVDDFVYFTVKIERVDVRAAKLMSSYLGTLGGALAMPGEAGENIRSCSDIIIKGSRNALKQLSLRLKDESFDLSAIACEIEQCLFIDDRKISWGNRVLDFSRKTYVMGILNCTPDSFYPGSRVPNRSSALKKAKEMIDSGVDILDVGGESSRPGSEFITAEEELSRVIPVIQAIRRESDIMISIDTRRREVAEIALDAGADIVNDISGLRDNKPLAELIASRKVPVIIMHMRGSPKTMQENPRYRNTISEILKELQSFIVFALGSGIPQNKIIVDPGIGFGKRIKDNLRIIKDLKSFQSLNFPVLIGVSRKSFIGEVLKAPVEERLIGTIAANTLAIINGANIIRVHDVGDAVDMVRIIDAVRGIGS